VSGQLFDVPVWALLVLAAAAGLWALLLAVLTTATRPRPVRPGPATLDLGGAEPPAIVNLLTNGWRMTTDALSATLLDLAARDLLDLVQTGPEPERTICRLRGTAPPDLTPYERRVYDRVAGLAAGGVVPVAALAQGNSAQAGRWWKGFRREVIVDAQRRGLSRNRWGAGIKSLTSAASVGPAVAAGLVAGYASEDGEPIWGVAVVTWVLLAGYAGSRNRQRDTPAGREVAARWLGLRDHLGRNEVFDTLPPAAVAIWDRYLGYGAAAGVAGTASRVLSFGAQDERLAWSAYGGTWHKVRIRYPGNRAAEGRHPLLSALVGLAALAVGWYGTKLVLGIRDRLGPGRSLGLGAAADEKLDSPWTQPVLLLVLAAVLVVGIWGAWVVVRAGLDLGGRRTFEAEVLRIRTLSNDKGVTEHQVALDDGRSERTRAWSVSPRRMPVVRERDVVSVTVGPWLHHVFALSVVRPGAAVQVDDAGPGLDSQVVEEPEPVRHSGWDSVPGAAGPDPATLFTAAEVGAALGQPVNPATALGGGAMFGMGVRMAEFAAVGGPARVVVQVATGRFAGAVGAGRGEPLPGGAMLRAGSVVVRGPGSVVSVHVRNADPAEPALRRLGTLAADRLRQFTA
jgi:Predicted membrane protein (DUF2207) C-terminal domain